MSEIAENALWFDAELRPHRSLSEVGRRRLLWVLGAICIIAGLRFWVLGAWPVMLFFALDIFLIWGAFRLNNFAARRREYIRLSREALDVKYVSALGHSRALSMEPYFAAVDVQYPGKHRAELSVRSRGTRAILGSFLTGEERTDLGHALRDALYRLKNNLPPNG